MRALRKNKRPLYYATYLGDEAIIEKGLDTLEREKKWSDPIELKCNYSANSGQMITDQFGNITEYTRTIVFVEDCPLKVNDKLWINRSIEENADYQVLKVGDGLNSYLVTVKEIV